ncbi:3-deoxy-8-phosphooctulonate synthase [Marivirga atlantica]|jgi:2-dehydro-3-deoxyphosphooctonate aldolase (KDO 8-P synthase)|uniref:2-dehydro-3-deoxyphosphooctonate aldolase n=1 Tax=Marivirga atlantica TaxID=1548457 RepID=A0A937DFP3_9BACT|nr:3-deoxy-8-phosphooctulonate synthase [Marivirga atlantica]MBL0766412.1 3-deoxy-8-phosphooctulonate synthase [Marivirga atlantica]
MKTFDKPIQVATKIEMGADRLVIFAGPCAAESNEILSETAAALKEIATKLDIDLVFKSSFDKANRTSLKSYRGPGLEKGLQMLDAIKSQYDLPLITDIHIPEQAAEVASVVDVLQIPAFLCRQTDLLVAAAKTGRCVKVKRGQFMAPEDMQYAVTKVKESGNENVCLTERGASFGYHNLVVDMRALPTMRQFAPVVFDTTHSVQQPGGAGGSSGGQREFAPYLGRAAAAAGVDGFFVETHPDPSVAKSDGPNMVPLADMENFLSMLKESWELGKKYS